MWAWLQLPLFGQEGESKKAAATRMKGKDDWTRTGRAGGSHRWWRCRVFAGFTRFPCWRPVTSSPLVGLYLWVTWLLMRPGNVCSVSVLNEPPIEEQQTQSPPHTWSSFHIWQQLPLYILWDRESPHMPSFSITNTQYDIETRNHVTFWLYLFLL